jgi:hypothetical protein
MHKESPIAAPQVNSMPIRFDLKRVPQTGSLPIFSLPKRPKLFDPSRTAGYDKATAFEAMCWIFAHTHGKAFERDSFLPSQV